MGELICSMLPLPQPASQATSSQQASKPTAEAGANSSPPSSRHTDGIPVAGVSWSEVWECLFNTRVGGWRKSLTLGQMEPSFKINMARGKKNNTKYKNPAKKTGQNWRSACSDVQVYQMQLQVETYTKHVLHWNNEPWFSHARMHAHNRIVFQ